MRTMTRRLATAFFVAAAAAAAVAPLLARRGDAAAMAAKDFPGWPAQYEGRALVELPLTQREAAFVRDFPGRVGRFSDGQREIIVRFVGAPTRLLHPSADCFRASGYAVTPLPMRRDQGGAPMACFRAEHGSDAVTICEIIRDDHGASWPDVSAWYWSALLGSGGGPWWSFVVSASQ
jgi:hypothetical protein